MRSGSPDGPGEVFLLSPGFNSFRSPVAQKRSGDGEAKYFYGMLPRERRIQICKAPPSEGGDPMSARPNIPHQQGRCMGGGGGILENWLAIEVGGSEFIVEGSDYLSLYPTWPFPNLIPGHLSVPSSKSTVPSVPFPTDPPPQPFTQNPPSLPLFRPPPPLPPPV